MNFKELFDPLERLITEHGSAAVLREHLALIKAQLAAAESQYANLQAENREIRAQLHDAENRASNAERELQQLKNSNPDGVFCDACGGRNVIRVGSRDDRLFGVLGEKRVSYRCTDCGAETEVLQRA